MSDNGNGHSNTLVLGNKTRDIPLREEQRVDPVEMAMRDVQASYGNYKQLKVAARALCKTRGHISKYAQMFDLIAEAQLEVQIDLTKALSEAQKRLDQ